MNADLIRNLVDAVPVYALGGGGLFLILLLVAAVLFRARFKLLKAAVRCMNTGEADPLVTSRLLRRPSLVEVLIRRKGEGVISFFGVADHLVRRLAARGRVEDVQRLLTLAPDEISFPAFMAALEKEIFAEVFRRWLQENTDILTLRQMALRSRGRKYDGVRGNRLLEARLEEVRELFGDSEWPVRFFALQILLIDDDAKSRRLVKDAFSDSRPLIRRTAAEEADFGDEQELYEILKNMVLNDPAPEVRLCSQKRIDQRFSDRWTLDPSSLTPLQSIHVLELLKVGSKEDENTAISALMGPAVEARLTAARFLEKSGSLRRIFLGANRGDREDWRRRLEQLSHAVSVDAAGFLDEVRNTNSTDVLLLGGSLLAEGGDRSIISSLAEKVFHRADPISSADESELYRLTLRLACAHGDERAHVLVRDELRKRRREKEVLQFILPQLPTGETRVFRDVLLDFLHDDHFAADDALETIMAQLPPVMFLDAVLDILESDRSRHAHSVRLKALRCLASWHLDYTLQTIVENLPILPLDQARDFSAHLSAMDRRKLEERAEFLLSSPDSGIRSALIACLPETSVATFINEIRTGLKDADPNVRIASLMTLFDTGKLEAAEPALGLLHDPVERVRQEAARILGAQADKKFLKALEVILHNEDESPVVRTAVLEGLLASPSTLAVEIMLQFLDQGDDLREELLGVMARRTDKKSITVMVEHFKDSEALLRDRIAEVFTAMGEGSEATLIALLEEGIPSLKPFITDILTRTGFVEILIRELGHRKTQVRRKAARILGKIATESAYRGIILAARDPDRAVRVVVVRALEALSAPGSETILESIKMDPDRKVRRYVHWAMERLRMKRLP